MQEIPRSEAEWLQVLMDLARFLRSPEGCPWDRKQTCQSFARFVGEEAEELLEAVELGDNDHIAEEWGDTLFTLFATAAAAEAEGRFGLKTALERAHEKMVRRHAHVFGEHSADTAEEAVDVWQKIKAEEKALKKRDQ